MKKNIQKIYIFIFLIFIISFILSITCITELILLKNEALEQSNLLNNYNNEIIKNSQNEISNIQETHEITEENTKQTKVIETERMLQIKELQKENIDIIGWIEIQGTNINYPVLQGTDDEYYMTHNYKKEKTKNGSIFLSKDYNWSIPSSNLLIYGHNLGNGTMFQELLKYESQEFYIQHPTIRFTTATEDAEYEIIAVFKSRVYYKSEQNVFRYYYFVNAATEEEYNQFVNNAKNASLYNIDATAEYGDQLITLSTCSYHVKDGRFAVVGRKK